MVHDNRWRDIGQADSLGKDRNKIGVWEAKYQERQGNGPDKNNH